LGNKSESKVGKIILKAKFETQKKTMPARAVCPAWPASPVLAWHVSTPAAGLLLCAALPNLFF